MKSIALFLSTVAGRIVLFGFLYVSLFWFQAMRLGLMERPAKLFVACAAAWLVLFITSVANTARAAAIIAVIMLLGITVDTFIPGTADSAKTVLVAGGKRMQSALHKSARDEPLQVPCDRTTAPRQVFFAENPATGEAESVVWYSQDDRRLICWDRPGVHPRTARSLEPVSPTVVELIVLQEPPAGVPPQEPEVDFGPVYEEAAEFRPVIVR